jgi:hypothetical protein
MRRRDFIRLLGGAGITLTPSEPIQSKIPVGSQDRLDTGAAREHGG